jgi:hypothetical protein
MKSYALWLAITWIVDGVFDGCSEAVTLGDQSFLRSVVSRTVLSNNKYILNDSQNQNKGKESSSATLTDNPLVDSVLRTFHSLYERFFTMTRQYREKTPLAWNFYESTYFDFIDTLIPTKEMKINTEKTYRQWRIQSGAIPCVIWQLCFYEGLDPSLISTPISDDVSCIVSYHNDILSLDRDEANGTQNIVSVLREEHSTDTYDAYVSAVNLIDSLYEKVDIMMIGRDDSTKKLIEACLLGSFAWTIKEERYKTGLELLREYKDGRLTKATIDNSLKSYGKEGGKSAGEV